MEKNFKIVAIAGSLRKVSYTRFALNIALKAAEELGADVELIDLREYDLPFCEQFEGEEDLPQDVFKFKEKVRNADGIILGTPEYHGGYSGVIKNAIDLIGRKEIENKTVGLVGVAGGSLGAANSLNGLRIITRHLHAWTVPQHVSVPGASSKFDSEGNCLDKAVESRLIELGQLVVRYGRLHNNLEEKIKN